MHIPDHIVNEPVSISTGIISTFSLLVTSYLALKSKIKPSIIKFISVTSFIFAMQMLNYPVQSGTSGHVIGIILAMLILGAPFGILSISLVVFIQAMFFGDGGITALGVNIFNMALVGAIPYLLLSKMKINKIINLNNLLSNSIIIFISWISIVLASFFCSIELSLSGIVNFFDVSFSMVSIHAIIGIGEGLFTLMLFKVALKIEADFSERKFGYCFLIGSIIITALLSPFASIKPDGFEWVGMQLNFLKESLPVFSSPFQDYSIGFINNQFLSQSSAGIIGIFLISFFIIVLNKIINLKGMYNNRKL